MPKFIAVPSVVEENLVLPLRGADGQERDYTVKAATAQQYLTLSVLKLQAMGVDAVGADLERAKAIDTIEKAWGTTLGEDVLRAMLADGVSAADLRRATQTAFYWHTADGDDTLAERAWSGKASTTPSPEKIPSEEAGAEAPTTSGPASTPGTSTRSAKPRRPRTSPGRTSGKTST